MISSQLKSGPMITPWAEFGRKVRDEVVHFGKEFVEMSWIVPGVIPHSSPFSPPPTDIPHSSPFSPPPTDNPIAHPSPRHPQTTRCTATVGWPGSFACAPKPPPRTCRPPWTAPCATWRRACCRRGWRLPPARRTRLRRPARSASARPSDSWI